MKFCFNALPLEDYLSPHFAHYLPIRLFLLVAPLSIDFGVHIDGSFPGFSLDVALRLANRNRCDLLLDLTGNLDSCA